MRRRKKPMDFAVFLVVMVLLAIGIVMVFSASAVKAYWDYGDPYHFFKRQLAWGVIGFVAMIFAANYDYWRLRTWAKPLFYVSIALLVFVLIPGLGIEVNGARRWLGFGGFRLQPSEMIKLAIVVYMAASFAPNPSKVRDFWQGLVPLLVAVGISGVLIMSQPDLGTAIAVAGTAFVFLVIVGAQASHMTVLATLALPVISWAIVSEEYRLRRFLAFLNPWADPLDSGFHIIQALYALGSGGLFGLGLGQGRQKWFYLPEQHTDFIFAIIGEEMGFLGCAVLMLLYGFLLWRGFRIAITAPDTFSTLLAAGIISMIGLQAIVNIGVVTATLPITGIPLPFVSFGGSSLFFSMVGVGIMLNISKYCN